MGKFRNDLSCILFQRLNIVKGAYEPTEAEAKCAFDGDEVGEE